MITEDPDQRYYRMSQLKSPALDVELALFLASHEPHEAALAVKLVAEKKVASCYAKIPELYNLWSTLLAPKDPAFEVRMSCIATMGAQNIGPDHLFLHAANIRAPLINGKDPAAFTRMFAILWLTERKNPAAGVLAKIALDTEPDPGMRQTMASLLARADPKLAIDTIHQKLPLEPDLRLRSQYLVALLCAGRAAAEPELFAALKSATSEFLPILAYDLALARLPESFPLIQKTLKLRRNPQDRINLITVLADIGGPDQRNALIPLIPTASKDEAETIIRAVGAYEAADLALLQSTAAKTSPALGALAKEVLAQAELQRQDWRETR